MRGNCLVYFLFYAALGFGLLGYSVFCFWFALRVKTGPLGKTIQQEEANLDWGSGDIVSVLISVLIPRMVGEWLKKKEAL